MRATELGEAVAREKLPPWQDVFSLSSLYFYYFIFHLIDWDHDGKLPGMQDFPPWFLLAGTWFSWQWSPNGILCRSSFFFVTHARLRLLASSFHMKKPKPMQSIFSNDRQGWIVFEEVETGNEQIKDACICGQLVSASPISWILDEAYLPNEGTHACCRHPHT